MSTPDFTSIQAKQYSFHLIMDFKPTRELFLKHCLSSHNEEQTLILQNILEFMELLSAKNRVKKGEEIIKTFIQQDSPHEVNIDGKLRKRLISDFEISKDTKLDRMFFQEAEDSVTFDLIYDVFPRFVFEESFQDFMKKQFEKMGYEEFVSTFCLSSGDLEEMEKKIENYKNQASPIKRITEIEGMGFVHPVEFSEKELEELSQGQSSPFKTFASINTLIVEMLKPITGAPIHVTKNLLGIRSVNKSRREYLGSDITAWLRDNVGVDKGDSISSFIGLLIEKKILICTSSGKKSFEEKLVYYYPFKKRVVIVGGGYAALHAAKKLQHDFEVVVISPSPSHLYNIALYKLFSDPGYMSKLETPISSIADKSKHIVGTCDAVSPSGVYVNKEKIPFDYLIIATGYTYVCPFPIDVPLVQKDFIQDEMDIVQEVEDPITIVTGSSFKEIMGSLYSVHTAKTVAVVGGGPTGVEVAAEIAMKNKGLKVVLITQAASLVDRRPPVVQKAVYKAISNFPNIELLFSRRVTKVYKDRIFFKPNTNDPSARETSIQAQALIVCSGFRPNTSIMRQFMNDSLTLKGFISTNKQFQVQKNVNSLKIEELINETRLAIEKENEYFLKIQLSKTNLLDESGSETEGEGASNLEGEDTLAEDLEKNISSISTMNLTGQKSYQNIFAIGDVIDSPEEKCAYFAGVHGKLVAKNIMDLESFHPRVSKGLVSYEFGTHPFQSIYAVGNTGIYTDGTKVGAQGPKMLKIKDFFETKVKNFAN